MSQGFQPPTPEELNHFFPAYEVTDFIAQGGMGAVFRATQISLDRPVAIKILPHEMGLDPEFSSSFETEAKAMAMLNHPNLVKVFDFGNIEGILYIVMELAPGRSLFDSVHGKSVEMSEASRLISDMCRGLEHAHNAGLIHRDIKPANVLVDDSASPKIVDFGLARPLSNTHTGGTIYGTKGYTAPEVLTDPRNIDQRADIFSVGAMLYELLTGQMPPDPYVPASSLGDSDIAFDTIILKAIHPQRSLRYSNAGEMAEELDELAARLEQVSSQPAGLQVVTRPVQRSSSSLPHTRIQVKQPSSAPTIAIVLIALILVAAGVAFVLNHSSNEKERLAQAQAQLELQNEAQAKEAELRKSADLKAAKNKQKQDRLAKRRAEMKRQKKILQSNRKISEEQDKAAAIAEAKKLKREEASQRRERSEAAEKAAALTAAKTSTEFDHLSFIDEIRKLISDNTGHSISDYDASLAKNTGRYVRYSKRKIRKLNQDERTDAEREAEPYYKKVLAEGRIPKKIGETLYYLREVHSDHILKQDKIDREFAPELEVWREVYISNCQTKCDKLDADANAESITYLTKEIELVKQDWQRILLIAKTRKVEAPQIYEDIDEN